MVFVCAVILVLGCRSREAVDDPTVVQEALPPEPVDALPAGTAEATSKPAALDTTPNLGEVAVAEPADAVVEEPVQTAKLAEPARDLAASERASTFVSIEYEPPEVEEYEVGAPTPKFENVVQPLPRKEPIAPSGKPIEGPAADPIDGPSGVSIEGPEGVPIEGPKPKPIEGY